jgi:serpin B
MSGYWKLGGKAAAILVIFILSSCAGSSATPTPGSTGPLGSQAPARFDVVKGTTGLLSPAGDRGAAAAAQINDFGFDLLRKLDSSGNLCASPASIALALAMVEPGAKGQTLDEMVRVLHGFGSADESAQLVALLAQLHSKITYADANGIPLDPGATPDPARPDPIAELNVANQVFLQKGMRFEQPYLNGLSSTFDAGIGILDFRTAPEAARLTINAWASEATRGRIPNVLQPGDITPDTRIALANAIYLKAAWDTKFDKSKTQSASFTTGKGSTVSVPTMSGLLATGYVAGNGYKAVELPMGSGMFTMTVIVPDDLAAFVAGLSQSQLASILTAETKYDVTLTMPRFSLESRISLADTLIAMGMPTVFSDAADLSGMTTEERLEIDKVIHQANIDVVEEGTTAAAVTVVIGRAMGLPEPNPAVELHVDRPFVYLVRDTASGAVLFMGTVNDPSSK